MHEYTHEYQKPIAPRTYQMAWICRHPLIAFFVLTFAFSWSIYLVAGLSEFNNPTVLSRVLLIAGFGPSLSAILISRVISSGNTAPVPRRRVLLFILIFISSIVVEWLDHTWWGHPIDTQLIVVDAILITLAAAVVSSMYSRYQGVRETITPITRWRVGIVWYFIALGLWPMIILTGNVVAKSMSIAITPPSDWPAQPILLIVSESFVWFLLFGGPLNEESGWRGFAMPRLQRYFSPLLASLLLGTLWGLWHVPLHLMGAYYGGAWGAIIRIQEIPRTILFTWIYNRTKGSVLLTLLFHAAINTTSLFLPRSFPLILAICTLIATIVAIKEKMWRRLPDTATL